MSINWALLREIVESHDRFVVASHIRPDGDAVGSELAMAEMLVQKGKDCAIISGSMMPPRYAFLDPTHRVRRFPDELKATELEATEVIIIVDTSAWQQLGPVADFVRGSSAKKVIIDHHVGHDDMGAELFKDTEAPACGAILAEAVEHLGCAMTPEVALPLFVALATDTGWFRFSSTDGRTMRIAGALIDAGISVDGLYRRLFEENTLARLKLLGRSLDQIKVTCGGRLAYSAITLDDLRVTGAIPQDSEDLVNYTLSIAGVEVGMMLIEQRSGAVKVSFRSKYGLDCTRLASQFGGGGHREAAGATLDGPVPVAEARLLRAIETALGAQSAA